METIYKLQPHRTMYLRGFDGRGAAAALHSASDAGFTVSGVFRDLADFAVLVLWDADSVFEHFSARYLPDFDFTGISLSFDMALSGLQPIDSRKYASTDWPYLDYILEDGTTGRVDLRAHMTTSGASAASRTWTVNGTCEAFDRVTLWFQNYAFDFIVPGKKKIVFTFYWNPQGTVLSITLGGATYTYTVTAAGGESGAQCAAGLAAAAAGNADAACSVVSNTIEVTPKTDAGGTIVCSATGNGADTLWRALHPTYVVAADLRAQINGAAWAPEAPVTLSAGGSGADIVVSANTGADGNFATLYEMHKTETMYLTPAGATRLTGGVAPASYHMTLDFAALGLTAVRLMWLTFAPAIPNAAAFEDVEWSAVFSNWTVGDAAGKRALKVAGPGSVRVDSRSAWCTYVGVWGEEAGWYQRGFARHTAAVGNRVFVEYHCGQAHDLYVGTSLYSDRGIALVRVDEDAATELDCYLAAEPAVVTRRKIRRGMAAGGHLVEIELSGKNAASSGWHFYFDFLEAAVLSDVPDAAVSYPHLTAATDYDTDATYKLAPERLLWALDRAGMYGRLNHYLGVFWWAQRRRVGGSFPALTLTFGGTWADGDSVCLTIGGTVMGKSVFPADTASTIAAHFCHFINVSLVGVWASAAGTVLTIRCFTPEWSFTFAREHFSAGGTISESGSLEGGSTGIWEIDAGATPVLNRAARDWHSDFFSAIAARGWEAVASLSMEMVNPPDDPASGAVWAARFLDGAKVETSTGFASLLSTHCAFSDVVAAYQAAAYSEIAGLMVAAGLTPWLQFGEFCWWYFSNFDAATNPDGGMAFYDAHTSAAAASALGRALVPLRDADDDPAVNSYADAAFLRGLVRAHIDSIRAYVLVTYAGARFELLWPYDVNYPERTSSGLGGRLLRYVNLPVEYEGKSGSGLDALKIEALAFGSVERHLDRAREAMRFPYTGGRSWPRGDVRYLMPWFNGGCPWEQEYLMSALREELATTLWAWDHLCLLSWPLPMPAEGRKVLSAG